MPCRTIRSLRPSAIGSLSAIFASTALLGGSPQRIRLCSAMSASVTCVVVLDAGLAAELLPPVLDGVLHLGRPPTCRPSRSAALPVGRTMRKRVHEGVVDRALQAGRFAQRAVIGRGHDRPAVSLTLRKWAVHERSDCDRRAVAASASSMCDLQPASASCRAGTGRAAMSSVRARDVPRRRSITSGRRIAARRRRGRVPSARPGRRCVTQIAAGCSGACRW